MGKLSSRRVETAKPGRYIDGEGLMLEVSPTGAKSWVLRLQVQKRRRDIGLGALSTLSLEQARQVARHLRSVARAGDDPIAERDKKKVDIPSFKDAADACHEALKSGWTERTAKAFLSTLKLHVFPRIGKLRVDGIDEKDIVSVLAPIWATKPAAAAKLRQRIGIVLDYSKGSGWRSIGMPRDGLRGMLDKKKRGGHFAAMPYIDVPAFVASTLSKPDTAGRLALLFAILTAARSNEVRSAKWSHIDLEARTWTRPKELVKRARTAHVVTLSPSAIAVLKRAANLRTTMIDCLVFPGREGRPLADMTILKVLRDAGLTDTVHGFRSSFRDWAAELMPTIPDPVAEAALSHAVPDAVVAAYKRTSFIDMRRTLLDAWGDYVDGTPNVPRRFNLGACGTLQEQPRETDH